MDGADVGMGREAVMHIECFHHSMFGNGATVAAEFARLMTARGVTVSVNHMRDLKAKQPPAADLYVLSSPGRMGKPIRGARRFLIKVNLPAGTRCAVLTTEAAPQPNKRTGRVPTPEELAKWQRVRPIIDQILQEKGLVKVAEGCVQVTGLKGPLEAGWQQKVAEFAAALPVPT
jgi:hypothetical protein